MGDVAVDSNDWLRSVRKAAGFHTDADLARRLGGLPARVRSWSYGHRPPWRLVPPLADALGVSVEEVVVQLWGERPGDACPCGCSGVKVLPDDSEPKARVLRIKRRCEGCRGTTVYDPDKVRRDHRRLCEGCSKGRQRSERVTFTCVGYDDHGVTRHAARCPGTISLTPAQARRWGKREQGDTTWGKGEYRPKSWQRPFLDEPSRTFRCLRCATGSLSVRVMEKRLKEDAKLPGRIETGSERRRLWKTEAEELTPAFFEARPEGQRKALAKRRSTPMTQAARLSHAKGKILLWWSRPDPPKVIVYRCSFCRTWTLIREAEARRREYKLRGHQRCFHQWQATPEGRAYYRGRREGLPVVAPWEMPRVGRPGKSDYRLKFAWTIQNKLGKRIGVRQIASAYNVGTMTVSDGVHLIMADLSDPELVSEEFRRHIELLRASR